MTTDDNQTSHALIQAFRQMRHINLSGRKPVEGCTQAETMMLFVLHRSMEEGSTGLKASVLSQIMRVTQPTVSQMVNVLEARGLVERTADTQDRRAVRIKLSEEGQRIIKVVLDAMYEGTKDLIRHLGEERTHLLIEMLNDVFQYYNERSPLCSRPDQTPSE
jgi:DNA-binding MarR family transcriptional regulator